MTHRDFASIPLLVGAFTSGSWLPTNIDIDPSQIAKWVMWGLGAILILVQIRYFWKKTPK